VRKLNFLSFVILVIFSVGALTSGGCRDGQNSSDKAFVQVQNGEDIGLYKNRLIRIQGRLNAIPWQHLINIPERYPVVDYLDIEGRAQIVIYTKSKIPCSGPLIVEGKVVELTGTSKRPGSNEKVVEYQIFVDRWICQSGADRKE
jgi:hypothetical protein